MGNIIQYEYQLQYKNSNNKWVANEDFYTLKEAEIAFHNAVITDGLKYRLIEIPKPSDIKVIKESK